MKRIVYTRFDGGVSICCPAPSEISGMTNGGCQWWQNQPRGFLETQIERKIAAGISCDAAVRHAKAALSGGCTTAEALEIIRDVDCSRHGTAIELWDLDDVPPDRWFRDAWKRSQNGGPISINLKLAKPIQFKRAREFVEGENRRRSDELDSMGLIDVDWDRFRTLVRSARDEQDLKAVWPICP